MAVLTAWMVGYGLSGLTNQAYNPTIDIEFFVTGAAPVDTRSGLTQRTLVSNLPVSAAPRPVEASLSGAWFDDFYYRIHVAPPTISIGNLTAYQEREVIVWNSFLVPKLLGDLAVSDDAAGLTLTGSEEPPTTFAATEERTYALAVSTEGPPAINVVYTFDFPDAHAARLTVTGLRTTMWSFIPRSGYEETLEWKTDILPAFDKEQRLAIRTAPRQTFAYRHSLNADQFSRAKAIATGWAQRVFGVPVWGEHTRLTSIADGATFIPFNTAYADYRDGGLVALWESDAAAEAAEIDTVAPTGLNLKRPLTRAFTKVTVAPVRLCRALGGFDFSRFMSRINELSVDFEAFDTVDLASDPSAIYRGYPILDYCPLIVSPLAERISRAVDVFDNGQGRITVEDSSGWANRRYTVSMKKRTRADVWAVRQWLHSRKGRQKAFWLPSYNADAILIKPTGINPATITVSYVGVQQFYGGAVDLRIKMNNGATHYAQVVSASPGINGGEELLLSTPLGTPNIDPADVRQISVMTLVRLDADAVSIGYDDSWFATMTVSAVGVPDL